MYRAPMSNSRLGQWFCEVASNPSKSSVVVARWLGSNFPPLPRLTNALGSSGPQNEGADENMAYEVFYTYNVNDSMTVTPALFIIENNNAGAEDQTGVVVKTSFSF